MMMMIMICWMIMAMVLDEKKNSHMIFNVIFASHSLCDNQKKRERYLNGYTHTQIVEVVSYDFFCFWLPLEKK